jgi:hypothetical protein
MRNNFQEITPPLVREHGTTPVLTPWIKNEQHTRSQNEHHSYSTDNSGPDSEPVRVETIEPGLQTLRNLVGGDIESVTRGDWDAHLNAEGVSANLPPNLAPLS